MHSNKEDHLQTGGSQEERGKKKNLKSISAPENRTPSVAITSVMFLEYSTSGTIINSDDTSTCNSLSVPNEMLHTVCTHVRQKKKINSPSKFSPLQL